MDILKGIRVLDLGRFVAAPYACWLLARMGAEVIRIEPPRGEFDRFSLAVTESGESTTFLPSAGGKKSVTLDLRRGGKAREILLKLVEKSDVVVENLGPGGAEVLGVTYDELRKVRHNIIVAHLTAFGSNGPYANKAGFDGVAQAMSGVTSLTGPPETPTRSGIPFVDHGTGALAALAIVAALYDRQRTGKGQQVEASLLATAVTWASAQILEHLVAKKKRNPPRLGNRAYWAGFGDICQTKDGKSVQVSVLGPMLARLFRAMGREDLAVDPRFSSDVEAFENRHVSDPLIRDWIASKTLAEMEEIAERLRIPVGQVVDYTEVAHHPQVMAEGLFVEAVSSDRTSTITTPACPVRFSSYPTADQVSIPSLGEHNDEVWCGLCGLSSSDLSDLKRQGII